MTRLRSVTASVNRLALETIAVRLLIVAGGFVSSVLTARWLSPAGRGEYFLVVTLAQMLAQFGNFGLQSSNTYLAARKTELAGALLANSMWVSIVVGGLGSLLVILVATTAGGATASLRLWLVVLLAPATLFYMLGTNLLVGLKQIETYNRFQLASNYGLLVCLFAAATLGAGATGFVAASTIGWSAAAIALMLVGRRHQRHSLRFSLPVFHDGVRYALKAYVATLCGYVLLRSNVFLLSAVKGPEQVGHFSVASQIADVVGILPQSIALVLFPTLITAVSGRFQTMLRNLAVVGALLGVGCALIWLEAEPFVRLLFGPRFAATVPVLRWMLPSAFFLGLTSITSQYLAASGFPPALAALWVVGTAISAAAGWLLIPAGGAIGAAMALSIAHGSVFIGVLGLSLHHAMRGARVQLVFPIVVEQGVAS